MSLLTLIQQQANKPIDQNWSNKIRVSGGVTNFLQLENEIEETDLLDLLGIALLQDLQDNPTEANNVILLDGGTYTDCNDNTIKFKGLRYALSYMIYYRYMNAINVQDTASGAVVKNSDESTRASKGQIDEKRNYSKEIALREFNRVKEYLNENSTTYPLWICSESKQPYKPKMYNLRNTIN